MSTIYDGIKWEVGEMPIGSSTPDDLFEYSYKAKGRCSECGNEITGTAKYLGRNEDGSDGKLNSVDYTPCEH